MFRDLIDPEYAFLREVGRPEWVFVDVGAAIGQFTVFAAGSIGGYVHAFEPSPVNLTTLTENVSRNGLEDRVAIHPLALSHWSGQEMFEAEANAFMGHLAVGGPVGKPVRVESLSRIAAELQIERISVLKINVAGGEPAVIAGALDFLAGGGATILIVLIGPQTFDALRQLADLGYRFFFFHPRERQLHEVSRLDDTGLSADQPWPARHVIGIWSDSVSEIAGDKVSVKPANG